MGSPRVEHGGMPETISVSDAARHLSLSPTTIHRMVDELPAFRVSGRWRLRVSDLEEWILRRRRPEDLPAEPVNYPGGEVRLHPYLDLRNIFLDVPETDAGGVIRASIGRARLAFGGSPGEADASALRDRVCRSVLEREELSSTAFHPDAAFPHPKDEDRHLLGSNQIVVVRALGPVEFRDACMHRPRIVFLLLARTISVQLIWEARLSYLLHGERLLPRLLAAASAEEVYEAFEGASGEDAS
jgi:excisionase family DNA binding protein